MITNFLKIAFRNLWQNKLYSFINIAGLGFGLAVCLLIMLYVAHERSYDKFHKNADRIFSVSSKGVYGGDSIQSFYTDYAFAPEIAKSDNRVSGYTRLHSPFTSTIIISAGKKGNKFSEKNLLYGDANFFDFFSFKLTSGNRKTALKEPFGVVISQRAAQKYFGNQNPMGQTMHVTADSTYLFRVTGVMENSPSNTDIKTDFIASGLSLRGMKENKDVLHGPNFKTYLLLDKGVIVSAVERTIGLRADKETSIPGRRYILNPLTSEHINLSRGDSSAGKYLKVFPLVAGLVLLLAWVNYMSLSTARATTRAKEIGVRKVSGAGRKIVAAQFYIESAVYAVLAFALAYMLYLLFNPVFLNILQINIDTSFLNSPIMIAGMAGLLLLTVLIAGSYPAVVLSGFKPIAVLSGKMSSNGGGSGVRKVFTLLQFSISGVLIIGGIIISRQLYFLRHTDTGVNRENVIMISIYKPMAGHYAAFKKQIESLPGIKLAATMRYSMYSSFDMFAVSPDGKGEPIVFKMLSVDNNFIPLTGIKWKFPPVSTSSVPQQNRAIVNETLLSKLRLSGNPVGQKIISGTNNDVEIGGVVKDFNFQSLNDKIDGLALFVAPDTLSYWTNHGCTLFAKINPKTNLPALIANIKQIYNRFDKENPLEYEFMDDAFNAMFKAEDRLAKIFNFFIRLAGLIAMMGLFGLSTFSALRHKKEIGIRKVLGASISQIVTLLSKSSIKLVATACIIASPIAWYAGNAWLQNFAYHIKIEWWMFALAGIGIILISLLTVSFQAVKAALTNPVKSLRTE